MPNRILTQEELSEALSDSTTAIRLYKLQIEYSDRSTRIESLNNALKKAINALNIYSKKYEEDYEMCLLLKNLISRISLSILFLRANIDFTEEILNESLLLDPEYMLVISYALGEICKPRDSVNPGYFEAIDNLINSLKGLKEFGSEEFANVCNTIIQRLSEVSSTNY